MTTKTTKNPLEAFLNLFAEVKPGEGIAVVLLFLNVFLILSAYYVLKVVREALTIGGVELWGIEGDEMKAYLSAVMALLMIGVVPAYSWVASRYDRMGLIKRTTAVVVAGLLGFFAWGTMTGVGTAIGLSFYVFLGIINVFLIAQFWSYANDIYSEKQGKRLFAIIAIGQSLGAVLGPKVAKLGADHVFVLLAGAAVTLGGCLLLYMFTNRIVGDTETEDKASTEAEEPLEKGGGFGLIFNNRYLLYIALMILCTNVVNTTGEYILSNAAKDYAEEQVPVSGVVQDLFDRHQAGATGDDAVPDDWTEWFNARSSSDIEDEITRNEWDLTGTLEDPVRSERSSAIGRFYGDFFFYVNICGLLIQMFFVSRIFKYFGVRAALFVLPVIAFIGYGAIGILGGLLVLRIAKTAENSTDYSLQNTVKQALFLPTSREEKYKAKAAIDMFFVRFGDAASAGLVYLGLHVLSFTTATFAFVNVGLCVIWVVLNIGIAREHKKLTPEDGELAKKVP